MDTVGCDRQTDTSVLGKCVYLKFLFALASSFLPASTYVFYLNNNFKRMPYISNYTKTCLK